MSKPDAAWPLGTVTVLGAHILEWYFGGLLWRLKKGTAGVKPVEDLVDPVPPRA